MAGRSRCLHASTSFRSWAERLSARARDAAVVSELSFWRGMLDAPSLALSRQRLDASRDLNGTAGQLTLTLPASVTEALLTRVPAAFHGGINDVLLTGLVLALADWRRAQGGARKCRLPVLRCCWISRATAARRTGSRAWT